MDNGLAWLVAAGVLVTLEIFSGTFYLLMIALGLAAGAIVAVAGMGTSIQFIIAAVVGAISTYALRRSKIGKKQNPAHDPNVNLDIGQTILVNVWHIDVAGNHVARIMYRGAMWDIELEPGATALPGAFVIREVRGSRLIVVNKSTNEHP